MDPLEAIAGYAAAKSCADVDGALQYCTDDVVIDTFPFQTRSVGVAETKEQLEAFFALFPDYTVQLEGLVEDGPTAVGWGAISATMSAPLGDIPSTGRGFTVPFTCVWDTRDGLIARERFYFDLHHVCEQLGIPTETVARTLHGVNEAYAERRAALAGR